MYDTKEGSVGMPGTTSLKESTKEWTRCRRAASVTEARGRGGSGKGVFKDVDRGGGGRDGLQ